MNVKCNKCGDESNSLPGLICGRVEQDLETLRVLSDPCMGTYQIKDAHGKQH